MTATSRSLAFARTRGLSHAGIVEGTLAGVALLIAAGGAVTLVAPALGPEPVTSTGQAGPIATVLVLVSGGLLVAAGSVAWFGRTDHRLALIALYAAAAWLGLELEGSGSVAKEARSIGMLLAPLFAPLAIHLPIRTLGADRGRSLTAILLAVLYIAVSIASVGRALTYDPFFDLDCSPVCALGDNMFMLRQDAWLATRSMELGLWASFLGSLGAIAWAAGWLMRGQATDRRKRQVLVLATAALGASVASWTGMRLSIDPALPADPILLVPALATAVSIAAVATAVIGVMVREMRRADALRELSGIVAAGSASSLRSTLARTLEDDWLRVVYPLDGGGYIDDQGSDVPKPLPSGARAVASVQRGETVIAMVDHAAGLDPDLIDREIGAAARLAVDNERLEATIRARLRELQASRARIVEVGDAARGRLERDLHDGAQQRLLAVSFELRLASAAVARSGGDPHDAAVLEQDVQQVDIALAELRELAHAIHPVVLTEDGLTGALASLVDESPVAMEVTGEAGRCPGPTELAGYLAVVEAIRRAGDVGADRLEVALDQDHEVLKIEIAGNGLQSGSWVRVEDRVAAAGGRMLLDEADPVRPALRITLPCG